MKNFYSLLIAGTMAVSGATAPAFAASPIKVVPQRVVNVSEKQDILSQTNVTSNLKKIKGLRKADNNPSVEGWWNLYFGDYLDDYLGNEPTGGFIPAQYKATLEDDQLHFTPSTSQFTLDKPFFDFYATYDAESQSVTIGQTFIGIEEGYYVFQEPYFFDGTIGPNGEYIDVKDFSGTFKPEEFKIEFEADYGLFWMAYSTPIPDPDDEESGYLVAYDIPFGYEFDNTAPLAGEWEPIGNATFIDPWLVPAMGMNNVKEAYEVPFEQNVENPYMFRLVNPYKYGPVAQWNGSEGGYITFDISDPQHVVFYPSDAGFYNTAIIPGGIDNFYCYNILGYEMINDPLLSVEEIVSLFGEIPFTKYENNTVTLGSKTYSSQVVYDANFGFQNNPYGGEWFQDEEGPVKMEGSIKFPNWFNAAVGAIAEDDSNAPVEYFNLNGMRVSNPQPGQIVIKRQGSKVSKSVIR